eukprot:1158687-Pelagomonas_calceolata.AAC.9
MLMDKFMTGKRSELMTSLMDKFMTGRRNISPDNASNSFFSLPETKCKDHALGDGLAMVVVEDTWNVQALGHGVEGGFQPYQRLDQD